MADTPNASPFLKWPGGKRWLAPSLAPTLGAELDGTYFEPFVGAASVFLSVNPQRALLSDTNDCLIDCLKTVRDQPERVVNSVWRFSNTANCYKLVRDRRSRTLVAKAARFLYLNRTCWGGVYRENKRGTFNVPFGNSGRKICKKSDVVAASKILSRAELRVSDFEACINLASSGDVVYADPPYTIKGRNNGFVRYNEKLFSWSDQVRLSKACRRAKRRGVFVAVSGLYHDDLIDLYPNWWALVVERASCVSRHAAGRCKVQEVVLLSRRPRLSVFSSSLTRVKASQQGQTYGRSTNDKTKR